MTDDFYDGAPRTISAEETDAFWDEPAGKDVYEVRQGRYQFPDPPGYTRERGQRGFMRMTNLAAAFSDQIRLQHWRERMILLGIREDEGLLFDELAAQGIENMDPREAKDWLEEHADKCAIRAGSTTGARRGTARHIMAQTWLETGVLTGHRTMRLQLESLVDALAQHYLEPISGWAERRVCNPKYHVMGTLDMGVLCQITGQIGILDLKTQRKFWSYLEIAGQQEGYDSAPWTWNGPANAAGQWVQSPKWNLMGAIGGNFEGKRVALLAHMPQEPGEFQLPVEIHEVDLSYGAEVMEHALKNVQLRSRGASVASGRRVGAPRPLPKVLARKA